MSDKENDSQYSLSQASSYSAATDARKSARLFACYLLVSESTDPKSKNRTYIGFTVSPPRRLRQHNGDLSAGGARRTKRHRPWAMVCVIHGFASKTQGLQFEWAWQHPKRSVCLQKHFDRPDALRLPSRSITSVNGRLQALAALTSIPPWSLCPLTLTVCAERSVWNDYKIDCVTFPNQLRVNFDPVESFTLAEGYNYRQRCDAVIPSGSCCPACNTTIHRDNNAGTRVTHCAKCGALTHLLCLADCRDDGDYVDKNSILPNFVRCPKCNHKLHWSLAVRLCRALATDDD